MDVISVDHLIKSYQVFKKEPGLVGTFKSLARRRYEKIKAVDDISFTVTEGELVGFIGPNGAGKTTTLKCLSGLLHPNSGQISVLDEIPWQRKSAFLKQISFIMGQKNQLWWDLPPMETFILNKEIYEIGDRQFKKTLADLVDLLKVKDILKVQVKRLSLGQRMKCELVAALLHSPKVLFLDEPTIGLDVVMQNNLREFIKNYNEHYQSTIILTSHYMRDVQALCKRVIIISNGKILFDGQLATLIKKHAPYKEISVVLKDNVPKEKLEQLGNIIEFEYPKVVIRTSSKNSQKVAQDLLSNFSIEDLNIEEADIEEVIREFFRRRQ